MEPKTARLTYAVATSVDGRIAHEDGTWGGMLEEGAHIGAFLDSLRDYDTVLMGRRTYEAGLAAGLPPGQPAYPGLEHFVFSRTLEMPAGSPVHVVAEDAVGFVRAMKADSARQMWLCGGGQLAGALLRAGLVDALMLKVNPTLFGAGVPLTEALGARIDLALEQSRTFESGAVFLTYQPVDLPLRAPHAREGAP